MKSQETITKDMTIGEVVNKHPESASIMLSYGLHCVGCAVNPFETIEMGAMGHGMDEKTVENLVSDINKAVIENEEVFEEHGIKIVVDKGLVDHIKGTKIDFVENEKGSGFKIDQYAAKESCGTGCGCSE